MGIERSRKSTPPLARRLTVFLFAVCVALVHARSAAAQRDRGVPPVYQPLYALLSSQLDQFESTVRALPERSLARPLTFGADFAYANNNIGPALFAPPFAAMAKIQADRFREMGIGGVHLVIQWPQMSRTYDPDYEKYLAFYRGIADELRAHHIAIYLHNMTVFGKPFSGYDHEVPKIGFAEYKREKRTMVENLIKAIHPEYYIVATEPMTDAHNTGIRELDDPSNSRELIDYVINGDGRGIGPLQKGTTLVGVGADNWESTDFAKGYVTIPNLDFLSLHVYPFGPIPQRTLLSLVDIGHSRNKRLTMDEAWLLKTGSRRDSQAESSKRNMFGFFEPLDERFLKLMADFCRKEGIEFLSAFWTRNFFAYIDYMEGDENRSFGELSDRLNPAARQAMEKGVLSPLGESYAKLAGGKPRR